MDSEIYTQTGVENLSQNIMPASKRSRSSSRSSTLSRATRRAKTTKATRIIPYAQKGNGPMWDPFPNRQVAILRYSTTVNIKPSVAGVAGVHQFRANGIHDPDLTGVGHQPYGHDQYSEIYNQYRVLKATIVMTPVNSFNGAYGCVLSDDTAIPAGYDWIKEVKGNQMATMVNNGGTVPSVVQTYKRNQAFDKNTSADGAFFGSSPSDQQIFACWKTEQQDTANPTDARFNIMISYIVEMFELKTFNQS